MPILIGLLGGVAVSMFSKTLAMVFGLAIFGIQVGDVVDGTMFDGLSKKM